MIIYKLTNIVNNKIYIGQTIQTLKKRWDGHGCKDSYIDRAIKKYGRNNFKKEIIVEGEFNKFLLDDLEKHYIRLYASNIKGIGYNLETGGNGKGKVLEESKLKMSLSHLGKKDSLETKLKKSKAQKLCQNRPEMLEMRSLYMMGNKIMEGKKLSEETKSKMSKSQSSFWKSLSKEDKFKKLQSLQTPLRENRLEVNKKISLSHLGKQYKDRQKSIEQIDLKTNLVIKVWNNLKEIENSLNYCNSNISECCTGKRKRAYGFVWKHVEKNK